MTFLGDSKDVLKKIYDDYGVNADVKLEKLVKNPKTDFWEIDYIGWIDFLTMKYSNDEIQVKFNANPLTTLFKSKLSAKVELERKDTLTGDPLAPLNIRKVYVEGRNILLTSSLSAESSRSIFTNNSTVLWVKAFDIKEEGDTNSGILDVNSQIPAIQPRKFLNKGVVVENFINENDNAFDMHYKVIVKLKQSLFWYYRDVNTLFGVRIAIYSGGTAFNYSRNIPIYEYAGDSDLMPTMLDINTGELNLTLANGESASLQYYMKDSVQSSELEILYAYPLSCWGGFGSYVDPDCVLQYVDDSGEWKPAFYECSVTVYEDSDRVFSTPYCARGYEFAKRLSDIVLECNFKSDLLGRTDLIGYDSNGELADIALIHGMWLRDMYSPQDKYKPINTSLKDFLTSLNVIFPIGVELWKNTMRIEKRSYFYSKEVTIKLGEVTDLSIYPDNKKYYSTITVGYEKAGGFDEEQGLDEYNRETQYNTILNKTDKDLKLISKYRADSYGLEKQRRLNPNVGINVDENKDGKFDDEIWFLDTTEIQDQPNLEVSHWSKRFAQAPKGVYSPETAFNLWFSPINIILNHGSWIKSPLVKYPNSEIKFNSSEGNSNLITKLIGGKEYTQNKGVPVEDLSEEVYLEEIAEFKAPVTREQLNGETNGKRNILGLIEFIDQRVTYKGFIISVSQNNGIGEWKVKIIS